MLGSAFNLPRDLTFTETLEDVADYKERVRNRRASRGTLAVLTEAGLAKLRAAWPTHLRGVAEHVTGRLTSEEVAQLGALLGKLVDDGALPTACIDVR